MKLLLVAGARPNFMKIASIVDAIHSHNQSVHNPIEYVLVHTGQHYDDKMSHTFFKELGIPAPTVNLEVGSASHAVQTAEVMKRFEPVLLQEQPDVVLVVGDVNSTVACTLVASKTNYAQPSRGGLIRPLIAHVEAGLRSFDRTMPEEVNRILTDALCDLLFVTEPSAQRHLRHEGVANSRIYFVGNTMVDTLLKHRKNAEESTILEKIGLSNVKHSPTNEGSDPLLGRRTGGRHRGIVRYALTTLHRPSNVDDRATFEGILEALAEVGRIVPVIFPIHPRTVGRIREFGFERHCTVLSPTDHLHESSLGVFCIEALGYLDFLCLMSHASVVLTDSGGIQEETTVLGISCVTMRSNTERPVTVTQGTNMLAGTRKADIVSHALRKLRQSTKPKRPKFWDGRAGERIIKILARQFDR